MTRGCIGAVVAVAALATFAHAQTVRYPCRTIEITVSYAAGGSTDLVARAIAQKFQERLGQPAVVPNVPTFKEAGVADFELASWNVLLAPKGAPADVVALLKRETLLALDDAQVSALLMAQGVEASPTQD